MNKINVEKLNKEAVLNCNNKKSIDFLGHHFIASDGIRLINNFEFSFKRYYI